MPTTQPRTNRSPESAVILGAYASSQSDATLLAILRECYEDSTTPVLTTFAYLGEWIRRNWTARNMMDRSEAERVCFFAFMLNALVTSGGFLSWLRDAYACFPDETMASLVAVGAPWDADLVSQAIQALPAELRQRIAERGVSSECLEFDVSPRMASALERLNAAFMGHQAADVYGGRLTTLIVEYARRHRVAVEARTRPV
jgi:hypothetical protein